jgi:hypothetical protein
MFGKKQESQPQLCKREAIFRLISMPLPKLEEKMTLVGAAQPRLCAMRKHQQRFGETPTRRNQKGQEKIHWKPNQHPQQAKPTPTTSQTRTHNKPNQHLQQAKPTLATSQNNARHKTNQCSQQAKRTPATSQANTRNRPNQHSQQAKTSQTNTCNKPNQHSQ